MTKLKHALLDAGVPQYKIARKVGITETRLSRLANGREVPTAGERTALSEALGVAEKTLFAKKTEVA